MLLCVLFFVGRALWVLCHVDGPITGNDFKEALYQGAVCAWIVLVAVLLFGYYF